MRSFEVAGIKFGLLALLVVFLAGGIAYATDQAIDMQNYEKLAKEGFANADGTRKIVEDALKKLEGNMDSSASELLQHEVQDAKLWFKKANDLLDKCKKQMDGKKFSKELVFDLNQSWQWFVKAGSAAVRASMMP